MENNKRKLREMYVWHNVFFNVVEDMPILHCSVNELNNAKNKLGYRKN